jgi:alginate O-acetyltransferase complex protein AlgI
LADDFASFEFLFLFLPLFFALYFLTPARHRNWTILLLSWGFYAWWRVDFLGLLLGVTIFTFIMARLIDRTAPGPTKNRLLAFGLVVILSVLAYFKYANFGVQTFNDAITAIGLTPSAGRRSSCRSASPSTCCNPSAT